VQEHAQLSVRLNGNHPAAQPHRILDVDVMAADGKIKFGSIIVFESALQIYLDERPNMRALCLGEAFDAVPASALAIVDLIERVPQHLGCKGAMGIEGEQVCDDLLESDIRAHVGASSPRAAAKDVIPRL
jgi:hypothetical protein